MVHVMLLPMLNVLYFYIGTSHSMCAVNNMAVFCTSLISCFPQMLFKYFLNDSEIVSVAPVFIKAYPPCSINSYLGDCI